MDTILLTIAALGLAFVGMAFFLAPKGDITGNAQLKKLCTQLDRGTKEVVSHHLTVVSMVGAAVAIGVAVLLPWNGVWVGLCIMVGVMASLFSAYAAQTFAVHAGHRLLGGRGERALMHAQVAAGLMAVGLVLVSCSGMFWLLFHVGALDIKAGLEVMVALSAGAAITAFGLRFSGALFAKAADMHADEHESKEAVVLDHIGDHAADTTGAAAEYTAHAYTGLIISALLVSQLLDGKTGALTAMHAAVPFMLIATGVLGMVVGLLAGKRGSTRQVLVRSLGAAVAVVISALCVISAVLSDGIVFLAGLIGIATWAATMFLSEWVGGAHFYFGKKLTESAKKGAGRVTLMGLTHGYVFAPITVAVVAVALAAGFMLSGWYGMSLVLTGAISLGPIMLGAKPYRGSGRYRPRA